MLWKPTSRSFSSRSLSRLNPALGNSRTKSQKISNPDPWTRPTLTEISCAAGDGAAAGAGAGAGAGTDAAEAALASGASALALNS